MFDIYKKALRYWWSSLPALVFFSAVIAGLEALLSSSGSKAGTASSFGATLFIIWYFHRHFLFHEAPLTSLNHPDHKVKRPFGRFMLVSFALVFLPLVPLVLISAGLSAGTAEQGAVAGVFALVIGPLYLATFSLFATALPASIDRDPRYRLLAGMRQAPRMAGYILAGPVLTATVLVALFLFALWRLPAAWGASPTAMFVTGTIAQTLGFLTSAVAAAAFCQVYRRIVPDDAPAAQPQP